MANNWAVVVGINHYEHHPERKLTYAVNDARRMRDFLCNEAGFTSEHVILALGDTEYKAASTYPSSNNLFKLLNRDLHPTQLGSVDQLWFFYSGHGVSRNGRDYLIPCDSFAEESERFILPIDEVVAALRRHQSAEIVLVLDACRQLLGEKNAGEAIGVQTLEVAKQRGITTIFSCDYSQSSYENQTLKSGSFTYALLEGLRQHTIPAQLEPYLQRRVRELNQQDGKSTNQTPLIRPEPGWKYHHPLLPSRTSPTDIAHLKETAIHAFADQDFDLAEQLWECVNNLATNPQDRQLSRKMLRDSAMRKAQSSFSAPVRAGLEDTSKQQPKPAAKPASTDDLSSEKGIDYTTLRDLLKASKWREADQETANRMCEAMRRQQQGWLRIEDIKAFPCVDLRTIDQLWVNYSNGHFGFSVQKKIWQECDSPTEYGTDWDKFCETVGWKVKKEAVHLFSAPYEDVHFRDLRYNPSFSLQGELPSVFWRCLGREDFGRIGWGVWLGDVKFGWWVRVLFSRAKTCKL